MSDIEFHCPKCGQRLVVDESGVGIRVPCPKCSVQIEIPSASPQPATVSCQSAGVSTKALEFYSFDLEQGTPEWLEWRHGGIGASDAPAIMGENPWKSVVELLREKRGRVREHKQNEAMVRGSQLEPEARIQYVARTGNNVRPACLQSCHFDWLRASVDGITADGTKVVEIKCGESVYRRTRESQFVPDYYYGQLQHILAVTGLGSIDFWCYLPGYPELLIQVARDDDYIRRLLATEKEFWNQVQVKRVRKKSKKQGEEADCQGNLEREFGRDGYFSDIYRQPSRAQFDAVWAWMGEHKLRYHSESSIAIAVDTLFPELRKRR